MSGETRLDTFRRLAGGGSVGRMLFTLDVGGIPGFTKPVMDRFRAETGSEKPEEFLDYDFRTVSLTARFAGDNPAALHEATPPGTTFDEWGIGHWAGGAAGTYEKAFAPLARAESVRDVDALPTPIPGDSADAEAAAQAYHARGYPVCGYAGSVYEWSWWLRGMEQFMMDLVLRPDIAEAIARKVSEYTKGLALRSAAAGIDVLCFYDDAGMQTGMQISPEAWRQFIKPRWADVLGTVRRQYPEAVFFLHSCGNIEDILPDIVDVGFQVLHPVQPECMCFDHMHKKFGRDIVLSASLSSQEVLPFGTPEQVREEVRRLKGVCAPDNRAIVAPSNLIQPETPWENIVAFAEEAGSPARRGK